VLADTDCTTKVCTKCSVEKPLTDFYPHKLGKHGKQSRCKPCINKARVEAARAQYQSDPEHRAKTIARQQKARLDRDPEARAKMSAYHAERHKRRRDTDPEYVLRRRATTNAWCAEQRKDTVFLDRQREYLRAYRAANPERKVLWDTLRKELLVAQNDGTITAQMILALKAACLRCPYCGEDIPSGSATLDHMDPVSRGGAHSVDNILFCCKTCNCRKRAKPFEKWLSLLDADAPRRIEEALALRDWLREGGVEQHFRPSASSGCESSTAA